MLCRYALLLLAAGLALIAGPASATDRHCRDGSCRREPPRHSDGASQRQKPRHATSYRRSSRARVLNQGLGYSDDDTPSLVAGGFGARDTAGVVVVAPLPLYAEDGTAPIFPYMHTDPAWKLCQFGGHRPRHHHRYTHCGPYSYHPYGLYGHRPFGSYRPYRARPVFVNAPSARIIHLRPIR